MSALHAENHIWTAGRHHCIGCLWPYQGLVAEIDKVVLLQFECERFYNKISVYMFHIFVSWLRRYFLQSAYSRKLMWNVSFVSQVRQGCSYCLPEAGDIVMLPMKSVSLVVAYSSMLFPKLFQAPHSSSQSPLDCLSPFGRLAPLKAMRLFYYFLFILWLQHFPSVPHDNCLWSIISG